MTDGGAEESEAQLARHTLGRTGVQVKLDKGFKTGDYCVYVEYRELADRIGFTTARRQALDYASRLHGQLAGTGGYAIDTIDDASRSGDPKRKRDLECSFLSFDVTSEDGYWHDNAVKEQFRIALLRAEQEWDQKQAKADERQRIDRRERFLHRLETLLEGEAYRQMDGAMKERLLAEGRGTGLSIQGKGALASEPLGYGQRCGEAGSSFCLLSFGNYKMRCRSQPRSVRFSGRRSSGGCGHSPGQDRWAGY